MARSSNAVRSSGWSNWSGRITAQPSEHLAPRDDTEVAAIVARATATRRRVRVRGTGHSNTPLCATDDVLLAPEGLAGLVAIDAVESSASVRSGTVLHDLAASLHAQGWALHNLGDIDVQTVGGAVGTATHGTGPTLGNLATTVRAATVVLADGTVVECSVDREPELFAALRPSLGAVGVVTEFTISIRPAYRLHERFWFADGSTALDSLADNIAATRHYEFFWHPHRDLVEHKALAITDADPDPMLHAKRERIDHWHHVLPSRRELRFNEMEYSVPATSGPECFAALRTRMLDRWPRVEWPVEYRTVAADDLWLSPHTGRDSVTISVHQGADLPCDPLFRDTEAILTEHGGRPHWGKVNFREGAVLRGRYAHWDDWWSLRDRLDPHDTFINPYLESLRSAAT
jgi:FAD/FMN-containing dehydrogenase